MCVCVCVCVHLCVCVHMCVVHIQCIVCLEESITHFCVYLNSMWYSHCQISLVYSNYQWLVIRWCLCMLVCVDCLYFGVGTLLHHTQCYWKDCLHLQAAKFHAAQSSSSLTFVKVVTTSLLSQVSLRHGKFCSEAYNRIFRLNLWVIEYPVLISWLFTYNIIVNKSIIILYSCCK